MNTADPGRAPGRILVVEDDAEAAFYAVYVLTTMGHFEVAHTPDPAVALRRASSEPWDLVLTNLDMPGMSGLELLGALRQAVRRFRSPSSRLTSPSAGAQTSCVRARTRSWRSRCRPRGSSRSRPH